MVRAAVPTAVSFGFLDRSRYFFLKVAPHLSSRGWVDSVSDPMLLRVSGSTRKLNRELWICNQELGPLNHRGSQLALLTRNYWGVRLNNITIYMNATLRFRYRQTDNKTLRRNSSLCTSNYEVHSMSTWRETAVMIKTSRKQRTSEASTQNVRCSGFRVKTPFKKPATENWGIVLHVPHATRAKPRHKLLPNDVESLCRRESCWQESPPP
jgi:hypothetical protein